LDGSGSLSATVAADRRKAALRPRRSTRAFPAAVAWAQAYYQAQREKGKSHACAPRCLGQHWLKILWKIWQTGQPYDEALHTLNQQKHGSWVLQLKPKAT
jgi:hypothetical protein